MPYHIIQWHIIPYDAIPYDTIPHQIVPLYHTIPYRYTISYQHTQRASLPTHTHFEEKANYMVVLRGEHPKHKKDKLDT